MKSPSQIKREGTRWGENTAYCISATMPVLDYPGRAMLTAWVSEAFPEIRKAVSGRAGRPRYPEPLKKANDIIKIWALICNS